MHHVKEEHLLIFDELLKFRLDSLNGLPNQRLRPLSQDDGDIEASIKPFGYYSQEATSFS